MLVVFAQMTVMLSSMNIMFSRIHLFVFTVFFFETTSMVFKVDFKTFLEILQQFLVKYKTKQFSSDRDIAMHGEIKTTFHCDHKIDVISRLFFMILFLTSRQIRFYWFANFSTKPKNRNIGQSCTYCNSSETDELQYLNRWIVIHIYNFDLYFCLFCTKWV